MSTIMRIVPAGLFGLAVVLAAAAPIRAADLELKPRAATAAAPSNPQSCPGLPSRAADDTPAGGAASIVRAAPRAVPSASGRAYRKPKRPTVAGRYAAACRPRAERAGCLAADR
jgi:hypothetical protein